MRSIEWRAAKPATLRTDGSGRYRRKMAYDVRVVGLSQDGSELWREMSVPWWPTMGLVKRLGLKLYPDSTPGYSDWTGRLTVSEAIELAVSLRPTQKFDGLNVWFETESRNLETKITSLKPDCIVEVWVYEWESGLD